MCACIHQEDSPPLLFLGTVVSASVTSLLPACATKKTVERHKSSTLLVGVVCALLAPLSSMLPAPLLLTCAPQDFVASVAWTSVFQGPFQCWHHLHTDADQHPCTGITEDSVASSLSNGRLSKKPSFSVLHSVAWPQRACSCSIIVSIESFRLHLVASLHKHSEQKQDAAYSWALSDPVGFVGHLHPLGDLDPVHHRVQQGVHRQCVLLSIFTVHFVSCNASFDGYTIVANSSLSSGHVRTDCARGNQSVSPSGTSSVRCLHLYRVRVCILCPSCPADVGLRTIQLVRRLCQIISASSNCADSPRHSMGSDSHSTFCIFG